MKTMTQSERRRTARVRACSLRFVHKVGRIGPWHLDWFDSETEAWVLAASARKLMALRPAVAMMRRYGFCNISLSIGYYP